MIVDFTITNFRSIKSEQTFSMYAENPGTNLLSNIFYPSESKVGVLKCSGIYGANASGKSNLLTAFRALRHIICNSGDLKEGDDIQCYEPYLLSEDTKSAPVRFEIEFFTPDSVRYKYVVSYTKTEIVEEYLDFYNSAKTASIFSRGAEDTWETINFGGFYKGGKKRHSLFENNAYISVAGNKADTPELVRNVYNYFRKEFFILDSDEHVRVADIENNEVLLKKVSAFLSFVDTGITGITTVERPGAEKVSFPNDMPKKLKDVLIQHEKVKFLFSHKTDTNVDESFELDEESSGTKKLFELAPVIFDAFENGGVLVFDELDNSMHPFMAELILKLFNDVRVNRSGAQLIFTTHNVNLMLPECFRRDQIWFTEKNDGETICYSLEDFDKKKIKSHSPFNKWYAEGRFGAVPKIDYQGIVGLFNASRESDAKAKKQ